MNKSALMLINKITCTDCLTLFNKIFLNFIKSSDSFERNIPRYQKSLDSFERNIPRYQKSLDSFE